MFEQLQVGICCEHCTS